MSFSDDLIDISPNTASPITPTVQSTTVTSRYQHQDQWALLEPDPPGPKRLSSRYDSPCPSIEVSPETSTPTPNKVSRSSNKNLVSIATRKSDQGPSTPTRAKAIPLPSSPGTEGYDGDTQSDGSHSTQSALSAEAQPFEAKSSAPAAAQVLRVSRLTPLSFFATDPKDKTKSTKSKTRSSQCTGSTSDAKAASRPAYPASSRWSDGASRVSADEMDPMYFQPGYGGAAANQSWSRQEQQKHQQQQPSRPCLLDDLVQDQGCSITTSSNEYEDRDKNDNHDDNDNGAPETATPMSMRYMQSAATRTASTDSSMSTSPPTRRVTLVDDDNSGTSGDEFDHNEPSITESFGSISLKSETDATESSADTHRQYHQGREDVPYRPIEEKLVSIAACRTRTSGPPPRLPSSDRYGRGKSGILTPENNGNNTQHRPPSTTPRVDRQDDPQEPELEKQEVGVNANDQDNQPLSVSHTAILESVLTLDETKNISRAFSSLIDAVRHCQHEIEEDLAKLRQGAYRQQHSVQGANQTAPVTPSLQPSDQSDKNLADARKVALGQIRGTKTRLAQATEEIANLKARLAESEEQLRAASVQIRVEEVKKLKSVVKLSQSKRRTQELAGRLIRLEEEHDVLLNLQEEQGDGHFVVVLLEADGRMFDPRLFSQQTANGGRQLVTNIIDKLTEQYLLVKGRDINRSQIVIHLFIDIEATSEELKVAGWISNKEELIRHLDDFRDVHPLVSVSHVPGLENDGSCILSRMSFYQRLSQCRMIVLGTGWNKPYRELIIEWEKDERIDKLYSIRSTAIFDVDPFKGLGPEKLLYIDRLWSVGVSEWRNLLRGIPQRVHTTTLMDSISSRQDSDSASAPTASRTSIATDQTTGSITPRGTSNRRPQISRSRSRSRSRSTSPVSVRVPTPPTTSSRPPWQVQTAPRPQPRAPSGSTGGSLLDQLNSMRSGTSTSSTTTSTRSSSPASDTTIGPARPSSRIPAYRSLNIDLDVTQEGSIGGSPPSSDSDKPSVLVPHGSRQHVRRPTAFADPDLGPYHEPDEDAGNTSEASTFTASTLSTSGSGLLGRRNLPGPPPPVKVKQASVPAANSSFAASRFRQRSKVVPKPYARNVNAEVAPSVSMISMANRTPLGGVSRPTSGQRMATRVTNMIELESRRAGSRIVGESGVGGTGAAAGMGTIHGFKLHDTSASARGQSNAASRRGTEEYKHLRWLDPSPCHYHYLKGHCARQDCKYGHQYNIDEDHMSMLRLLAKEMNCKRMPHVCNQREEDCIYSHRCPNGPMCKYGARCRFVDDAGYHVH